MSAKKQQHIGATNLGIQKPELREELDKRIWALSALSEATAALARADSQDRLVEEVCNAIVSQGPYLLAWVGRAEDDANKTIRVIGGAGSALAYIDNIAVSWSDQNITGLGPAGSCIRLGKPVISGDTEVDQEFLAWRDIARKFSIRSAVACSIQDGDRPFGCLVIYSNLPNAFGPDELLLFQSLAREIGFGIRAIDRQKKLDTEIHEKEIIQERLADALKATIEAMSKTMEWRDPYTAGHQKRVALISVAIAKKLEWSEESVQALYMAAMVHDIGKVAVPAEILTKPTRLTDLEMKMVQEHAATGYQILKDIPFPWPIAQMVYQHHERLDGSGYPLGLKGDEICQEARILAVADSIEAMATHRPYRPSRGLMVAMDEIKTEVGVKLDTKVVQAVIDLVKTSNVIQDILSTS
jgi:putative nucleotidyltransferase with HDIG domain